MASNPNLSLRINSLVALGANTVQSFQNECETIEKAFQDGDVCADVEAAILTTIKEEFGDNWETMKFAVRSSAVGM